MGIVEPQGKNKKVTAQSDFKPTKLITVKFNRQYFDGTKGNFIMVYDSVIKKLIYGEKNFAMSNNNAAKMINVWFLIQRKMRDYGCTYSQKRLRKELSLSDKTLNDCLTVLEENGIMERLKRYNPTHGNNEWLYYNTSFGAASKVTEHFSQTHSSTLEAGKGDRL